MKWRVYAVKLNGQWQLGLGCDMDFVQRFWSCQGALSIIILTQDLSIGHARYAYERLRLTVGEWGERWTDLEKWRRCRIKWRKHAWLLLEQPKESLSHPTVQDRETFEALLLKLESIFTWTRPYVQGRALLWQEFTEQLRRSIGPDEASDLLPMFLQWLLVDQHVEIKAGIERSYPSLFIERRWICSRCQVSGHLLEAPCAACGQPCMVCENCLAMGRSTFCTPYVLMKEEPIRHGKMRTVADDFHQHPTWAGELSPEQEAAVRVMLADLRRAPFLSREQTDGSGPAKANGPAQTNRFLLHAVCGAGKTEVTYPLISQTLANGSRVLFAAPRKEVVLEISLRLKQAFPSVDIVTLYGGSDEKGGIGSITVATTHQVMRFYRCFDLVILDEMDAFPYDQDPMLHAGVERAIHPRGFLLYLTATPPKALRRQVSRQVINGYVIPVRHHRHPLPVPREVYVWGKRALKEEVFRLAKRYAGKGLPVLVFVPWIEELKRLADEWAERLRDMPFVVEGVYAEDERRAERIKRFRDKKIHILLTTTILERGVTIPEVQVIVYRADAQVFSESALIQMAGRAGRARHAPDGDVWFAANERTWRIKSAIRSIRRMNRLAEQLTKAGESRC